MEMEDCFSFVASHIGQGDQQRDIPGNGFYRQLTVQLSDVSGGDATAGGGAEDKSGVGLRRKEFRGLHFMIPFVIEGLNAGSFYEGRDLRVCERRISCHIAGELP